MSNENRTLTAAERAALANAREAEAERRKYASARPVPTVQRAPSQTIQKTRVAPQRPQNTAAQRASAHNTNEYPNIKRTPATKPKTTKPQKEDTGEFPSYLRTGKGSGFKGFKPKKQEKRQVAKQHRRKMDPRLRAVLLALAAVAAIILLLLIIGVRYTTFDLADGGKIKFFGIAKGGNPVSGWVSNSESGIKGKLSENKIEYSDGSLYEGTIVNGMRSGQGKYTDANGNIYEGAFTLDEMNGNFTVHYADGSTYIGGYVSGEKSGNGTLTYKRENGFDIYEGAFLNDKRHGKGTMTYADGNVYIGDYENDWRCGEGEIRFANGDTYIGKFANDLKTEGVYKFANDAEFVGTFVQDSTNDMLRGTYKFTNGTTVTGKYDRSTDTFIAE